MTAALRYEWRRLWTIRSTYWLIGITLGLQGALTLLVAAVVSASGGAEIAAAEQVVTSIITLGASFGQSPLFPAYLIAMFGVFTFGHEYRYGMVRATLTAVPNRTAVFGAKVAVNAFVAAALSLVCNLLGLLWCLAFIDVDGALGSGEVWKVVLGTTLYTVLFVLCAIGTTSLVRNQTGALALVLLFPLVVENVLKVILTVLSLLGDNDLDEVTKVFPFDAGAQMYVGPGADLLNEATGYEPFGPVAGGLVLLGFTVGLLGGAYALFLRRDA